MSMPSKPTSLSILNFSTSDAFPWTMLNLTAFLKRRSAPSAASPDAAPVARAAEAAAHDVLRKSRRSRKSSMSISSFEDMRIGAGLGDMVTAAGWRSQSQAPSDVSGDWPQTGLLERRTSNVALRIPDAAPRFDI